MKRRTLLKFLALGAFVPHTHAQPKAAKKGIKEMQDNWKSFLAPGTPVPNAAEPLKLTKEEWRKRLTPAAYNVLREEGTERAGSSPLDREKRAGVFVCAGCDLPVFTTEMKFDSGTGWPSFFTYIPGAFQTKTDYKIIYLAPSTTAPSAAATTATSSTTARRPPASAIATTASR